MIIKKTTEQDSRNHENLGLDKIDRLNIVREERFIAADDWTLKIDGYSDPIRINNYSSFGVMATSSFKLPEKFTAELFIKDKSIRSINFSVKRDNFENNIFESGLEIDDDPLDINYFQGLSRANEIMNNIKDLHHINVPIELIQIIYDIKYFFENFEKQTTEVENSMNFTSEIEIKSFEEAFCSYSGDEISNFLRPKFAQIIRLTKNLDKSTLKNTIDYFRETLKDYLYLSPYVERAYTKPLGYAGDFEMMRYIYEDDLLGKNLLAKCIHKFYMAQPGVNAVRNRRFFMYGKIKDFYLKKNKKISVLSVACGPAEEVALILENDSDFNNNTIEIDLLDQDIRSLQYARRNIKTATKRVNKNINLNYLNIGIKNVIKEGLEKKYDLIYSAGLFDYFDDKIAIFTAKQLYKSLNPGGILLIGNFKEESIDRFQLEFIGDWYLVYRSEKDLKKLYENVSSKVRIESEDELLNLFAIIEKD